MPIPHSFFCLLLLNATQITNSMTPMSKQRHNTAADFEEAGLDLEQVTTHGTLQENFEEEESESSEEDEHDI